MKFNLYAERVSPQTEVNSFNLMVPGLFSGGFTIIASSSEMSTTCHQYAIPFLCYFTFPLCDPTVEEPRPRQVCRDECEELEQHICEKEYRLGMNHPDIGKAPATTAVKNRGVTQIFEWLMQTSLNFVLLY